MCAVAPPRPRIHGVPATHLVPGRAKHALSDLSDSETADLFEVGAIASE